MRHIRQLLASAVLLAMLTVIALAGEIHTGVAPPAPEPTPTATSESCNEGTLLDPLIEWTRSILDALL